MAGWALSLQKMTNNPARGLQSRLIKVFAIQATLVSIATVLGVLAAYSIAENVLVKQALRGEAQHYWMLYQTQSDHPLPNTNNMMAYLASVDSPHSLATLPVPLQSLEPNFFGRVDLEGHSPLVLVEQEGKERLYLVFKEEQVSQLAIMFGVAPLSVVLILIYLASWVTFRQSQKVISPVTDLAKIVETSNIYDGFVLEDQLGPLMGIDADIDALATALSNYSKRLQRFVDRERSFTRNASHELRTPLAVLKGSVDILSHQSELTDQQRTVVTRMEKTTTQMESLIETLLLLAKEGHQKSVKGHINLPLLVRQTIEQVKLAIPSASSKINLIVHEEAVITASEHVVSIVLTNLIRNALQHGNSQPITIELTQTSVSVMDQGDGMDQETLQRVFEPFQRNTSNTAGYGLGLSIVQQLCESHGWQIDAYSNLGEGTRMAVHFSNSRHKQEDDNREQDTM